MRAEKPRKVQLHTTKLRTENSRDYVPVVNGVDQDTLWQTMVTVSRVDIVV
jgi:hypothetical protein